MQLDPIRICELLGGLGYVNVLGCRAAGSAGVYSTVIGVATEVEVLRAVGIEPTLKSMVRRRTELLGFLRSALMLPT